MRNRYSCLRIGISGEWIDFLGSIKLGKLLGQFSWVAITRILRYCDLPFWSNKSAMTSSTSRSGCTSHFPRDFGAFFDCVSVYIRRRELDRMSSRVRNSCLLLRFRQRLFMDIQHRHKKPKIYSRIALTTRKNRKSGTLQFRLFRFARISIFCHSVRC